MKFMNLSPTTDFYSKFQLQIDILMKNVLYVTHECDKILKIVKKLEIDRNLQHSVDEYFERDETSPQTDTVEQQLVIKTGVKQKRPSLPSKRPFGTIADITRQALKHYGVYQKYNLHRYDPDVFIKRYSYKPRKRVAGYLGQKLHKKKVKLSYNKFRKTRFISFNLLNCHQYQNSNCQSGYRTK